MYNNTIKKCTLFLLGTLLASAPAQAAGKRSRLAKQEHWTDSLSVCVDASFGINAIEVAPKEKKERKNISNSGYNASFDSSNNYSFGVLGGYYFPLSSSWKLGALLGLEYGFTRQLEVSSEIINLSITENCWAIPLGIHIKRCYDEESIIRSQGCTIGYAPEITTTSKLEREVSPSSPGTLSGIFAGPAEQDLVKTITNFPSLSGSWLIRYTLEFPKGIYLGGCFKFPKEVFSAEEKSNNVTTEDFLQAARMLTKPLLTFNLGADIMQWF